MSSIFDVSFAALSPLTQGREIVAIDAQDKLDHLVHVHCELRLLIQVEDQFLHCLVRLVDRRPVLQLRHDGKIVELS